MDSYEAIQKSRVLFGSNFDSWKQRLVSLLRVRQLDAYLAEEPGVWDEGIDLGAWAHGQKKAAKLILLMISPDLLSRIPTSERRNAALVMKRLEAISTCLRFLDLPSELRNQIYKFYLAGSGRVKIIPNQGIINRKLTGYYGITKVSHQIRREHYLSSMRLLYLS